MIGYRPELGVLAALLAGACAEPKLPDPPGAADSAAVQETGGAEPLTLGEVIACEAPAEAVRYVESGGAWGLQPGPEPDGDHLDGGGVAVHDFDGDGDLDLVLAYSQSDLTFYQREGEGFREWLLQEGRLGAQLGLADADGDGRIDLLLSGPAPAIYFNDGEGLHRGPDLALIEQGLVRQLAPADLDGDGDVDLYAATAAPEDEASRTDFLLWNDGAGGYTLDQETLPTDQVDGLRGQGFLALVFDWQLDGDPDLYLDNDMGSQVGANVLIRNDDGALSDGSADCACGIAHSGMGGDVADYNGDGWPDLYLSATGQPLLLAGQADGTFVDVTISAGADPVVEDTQMTWGTAWLDYDNDGQLDLLIAQGDLWAADHPGDVFEAPITLLRQDGGVFEDASAALGLATEGSWRGVSAADYNSDGVLDLLVTGVVDRPLLYLSQGCTAAGWLAVEAPLGSRVTISAGGRTQVGWVRPTSGFGAAGPLEVWFGLGAAQVVDSLRVELPWGAGVYERSAPFDARRRVSAP